MKVRITEYLEIDIGTEDWCCQRCGHPLISARDNFKKGCLVAERPMNEVHPPIVEGKAFSYCFDPDYCRLIEYYCPNCGIMIENEYLPPGHPIANYLDLDIDSLKRKHGM
ncbi:MAG: acetophenone carboxylase [Desulfobacterales bacterium]|nr:acetophenone carboxylase [Desulfobacterales bacterium]MBL7102281.1 acetophenone carboxylase [Desulfobacteraceae bacterium]